MANEFKHLSNYIPEIKLSYEKLFHNKVYNIEYYVSIPYGKKYLAWFRNFYGKEIRTPCGWILLFNLWN